MKGTIANFRSSRHRQKHNHMIVVVDSVDTKEKAEKLVGRSVKYLTEAEREILGKVASAHGNSGAVRVIFDKGMPGQSISRTVEII